jgi:small nuclear ribonucleoprotein (snRNP)-like protein
VGIRGKILALHFQRGVAIERVHAVDPRRVRCRNVPSPPHQIVEFKFKILCHLMRDTEAVRNLKSILRGTLRVIINDNRAFVGTFVGTDKSLNILLLNTEEFRLDAGENTAGRYVGQVMIPWRIIQSIGLQIGETNPQADPEQVRVPTKFCPLQATLP